jgi:signal peptidase II
MVTKNYRKILFYISIVIIIFLLDRISKLYILSLAQENSILDIYINSFLNFYLIWNTGIGFGLFSFDQSLMYNLITIFIIILNIIILIMIYRSNDYKVFFLLLILGGSFGNLFDRIYYSAVPDFIDLHIQNFHWFIFNVADIFITIGIIFLIIIEIFAKKENENETK